MPRAPRMMDTSRSRSQPSPSHYHCQQKWYHVATGSVDNTIRIWDLRRRETQQTIPAQSKIVRAVRYQPGNGLILASASYDRACRLWNAARDYAPLATLAGHEHNVMGVDVSADGRTYVSAAYDRTFKIWRPAEVQ